MSFSALEQTKIFQLLGIPLGGGGLVVTSLSHLPPTLAATWTATYTEGQFTQIVTQVQTYLTAATTSIISIVQGLLAKYDDCVASPMIVEASGDSRGTLINHPKQVEMIRLEVAKLLGVWCPRGGFIAESEKLYNGASGGSMGFGMRAGDR